MRLSTSIGDNALARERDAGRPWHHGAFAAPAFDPIRILWGGTQAAAAVQLARIRPGDPVSLAAAPPPSVGDDDLTGGPGDDTFRLEQGGSDRARGFGGDDGFYFGATFDATDDIDGGDGDNDQLGLQGMYNQEIGGNITNVEVIALLSGSDTSFGATGTSLYSYAITATDDLVADGGRLIVNSNGLRAGETLSFDGSAETDGVFTTYAGLGDDILIGGAGSDGFYFGEGDRFTVADRVDGRGGADDQIGLRGDYATQLVFTASTMVGIETIALLSASAVRIGPPGLAYDYNIKIHDANVASGAQLTVTGAGLRADESLIFDGSSESDGRFRFIGGQGDDQATGGAGGDTLFGGAGADLLSGGEGADRIEDGGGSDNAHGGGGADTFIWRPGNATDADMLAGDTGTDTLRLEFTGAQWAAAGLQQEVAELVQFAADRAAGRVLETDSHALDSHDLTVSGFEQVEILVDGQPVTVTPPALTMALAVSDRLAGAARESGAARVMLTGTGTPGETVKLYDAAGREIASTIVAVDGGFRFAGVALALGENDLTARSFAAGGSITATSRIELVRVDDAVAGNAVIDWIETALDVLAIDAATPTFASRALAMQGHAMMNVVAAVNGVPGYLFSMDAAPGASLDAAVATAAHDLLLALFPGQSDLLDARLAATLAAIPDGAAENDGIGLGAASAARIVALRADDGWNEVVSVTGEDAVGAWQPTGPLFMPALDPQWATLAPFAIDRPDRFDPGAPPAIGSAEWIADYNEVKALGAGDSVVRTAEQTLIARFWAAGVGTVTPPGMWARIAAAAAAGGDLSPSDAALLFARLGLALGDAGIAAWDTKFDYDTWRPITAIQYAGLLDDPNVVADTDWQSYLLTPPFPEYVSGHSTFSAAGAAVLSAMFGDNYQFSLSSGSAGGAIRSFASFAAAAAEAGMSRIYGGIHFDFSNIAGKALGSDVGAYILDLFNGTVDLFAPRITFTSKSGVIAVQDIVVAGSASDDLAGVAALSYSIDGGAFSTLTFNGLGNFALDLGGLGLADGGHSVTFRAVDGTGKTADAVFNLILAGAAPLIALAGAGVGDGETVTGAGRLIGQVELDAGNRLTALGYSIGGGRVVPIAFGSDGAFDAALDLSRVDPGAATIRIVAQDAAGRVVEQVIDVTIGVTSFEIVAIKPDPEEMGVGVTYRPSVTFSRPVDAATLTDQSFYATDSAGVKIAANIVPFTDGTGAWLLFAQTLPGNELITLHLEGERIAATDGTLLSGDGNAPGSDREVSFTTVSLTGVPGTTITGIVLDPGPDLEPMTADDVRAGPNGLNDFANNSYRLPLAGVRVYILGREDLAVFTDANGRFTIANAPTGHVTLAVDGRTATNAPDGLFFPEMVMDVVVRAGIVNTAMGGMGSFDAQRANQANPAVYLPRIDADALVAVDDDAPTIVTASSNGGAGLVGDQLLQVTLTVQPGTMLDAAGNPVVNPTIAIAPVPPSLVMDMLPPGVLQHSFDITIQAPGTAIFSEELVLTMPNVFNLLPGEKTFILSFDHTSGRLVINGTGTVSADGLTITSDPGSGIVAPGWHGVTDRLTRGRGGALERCGSPDDPQWDDVNNQARQLLDNLKNGIQDGFGLASDADSLLGVLDIGTGAAGNLITGINVGVHSAQTLTSLGNAASALSNGDLGGTAGFLAEGFVGATQTGFDVLGKVPAVGQLANGLGFLVGKAQSYGESLTDWGPEAPDFAQKIRAARLQANAARDLPGWQVGDRSTIDAAIDQKITTFEQKEQFFRAELARQQPLLERMANEVTDLMKFLAEFDPADPSAFVDDQGDNLQDIIDGMSDFLDALSDLVGGGDGSDFASLPELYSDLADAALDAIQAIVEQLGMPIDMPMPPGSQIVVEEASIVYGPTLFAVLTNLETGDEQRFQFNPQAGIDQALQPDTWYELEVYDPVSRETGVTVFVSGGAGTITRIPDIMLFRDTGAVGVNGLTATANQVLGIDPDRADNFVPGIPDSEALEQGIADAPALANVNGVVAAIGLRGEAREIVLASGGDVAGGLTAYVATGSHGLAIIDVSNPRSPLILAQLDLPGSAIDVAVDIANGLAGIALGAAGLAIVDVADRADPVVIGTLGRTVHHIELSGALAYLYGNDGILRAYDLAAREEVGAFTMGTGAVLLNAMVADGTRLYTLDNNRTLRLFEIDGTGGFELLSTFTLPGQIPVTSDRIAVGNDILYIPTGADAFDGGYATVDISNPFAPVLASLEDSATIAGGAGAVDGSRGLFVQQVQIANPGGGFALRNLLDVVETDDPAATGDLVARYDLGSAPVGLAVARGFAFVITAGGLEVVRYAPADLGGVGPTMTVFGPADVDANRPGIQFFQGQRVTFDVDARDDVAVREVEMLVNGQVVASDVTFGFDLSARLPSIADNGGSLVTIGFRATDTGGNATVYPSFQVELVADTSPFTIVSTTPIDEGVAGRNLRAVTVNFSKPVDPATVSSNAFRLAGPTGFVDPLTLQLRNDGRSVRITYEELAPGDYQLSIDAAAVRDLAGTPLGAAPTLVDFDVATFSVEWIGGAAGRWGNEANWSGGVLPGSTDHVVVNSPDNGDILFNSDAERVASLTLTGPGTFRMAGLFPGQADLFASALVNQGALRIETAAYLRMGGDIDNRGTIQVFASGLDAVIEIKAELAELTGGGEIILGGPGKARLVGEPWQGAFTANPLASRFVNVDNLIRGEGYIGRDMTIDNRGEIRAEGGRLDIEPYVFTVISQTAQNLPGELINTGLIVATDNSIVGFNTQFGFVFVNNHGGVIRAGGDNAIVIFGRGLYQGGLIDAIGAGAEIQALTGAIFSNIMIDVMQGSRMSGDIVLDGNPGAVRLRGNFQIFSDGSLVLAGAIDNGGRILTYPGLGGAAPVTLEDDTILTGGGSIELLSETGERALLWVVERYAPPDYDENGDEIPGPTLPPLRLTNVDNVIEGGGVIGGVSESQGWLYNGESGIGPDDFMSETFIIDNRAAGIIQGSRSVEDNGTNIVIPLVIDGMLIENAGLIRSWNFGQLDILNSAITQIGDGLVHADSGLLRLITGGGFNPDDDYGAMPLSTSITGGRLEVGLFGTLETSGYVDLIDVAVRVDGGTLRIGTYASPSLGASGRLTANGEMANDGRIEIAAARYGDVAPLDAALAIGFGGGTGALTVTGAGEIVLGTVVNGGVASISSGDFQLDYVFTNEGNKISGTGVIGDGRMDFYNRSGSQVEASGSDQLIIAARFTQNQGSFEIADGSDSAALIRFMAAFVNQSDVLDRGDGSVVFDGRVENEGFIGNEDAGGEMLFNGEVINHQTIEVKDGATTRFTGTAGGGGGYHVGDGGGTFIFEAGFSAMLLAEHGALAVQVADSSGFTGRVGHFGADDSILFEDIDFASAFIVSDQVNGSDRVITISDGADQVSVTLFEAVAATFTLVADPLGGGTAFVAG